MAIPLEGAGSTSAVMAGGNQFTSAVRPDLVSATITGASSASFCFDKPITAVADVGGFYLAGYTAAATSKSLNATASGNCVNAQVTTSPWFTFAQVGEGAARTTGNIANRADSVALSGSNTGNGTRGLTVVVDLQGVSIVSGAAQQIAFTYDEPVSSSAISATDGSPDGFDSAPAPGSAGVVAGVPALLSAQYSRQAGAGFLPVVVAACVVVDYTFNEGRLGARQRRVTGELLRLPVERDHRHLVHPEPRPGIRTRLARRRSVATPAARAPAIRPHRTRCSRRSTR